MVYNILNNMLKHISIMLLIFSALLLKSLLTLLTKMSITLCKTSLITKFCKIEKLWVHCVSKSFSLILRSWSNLSTVCWKIHSYFIKHINPRYYTVQNYSYESVNHILVPSISFKLFLHYIFAHLPTIINVFWVRRNGKPC